MGPKWLHYEGLEAKKVAWKWAGHAFRHVLARQLAASGGLESLKTLRLSGKLPERCEDFRAVPARINPGPNFGNPAFRVHQESIPG